MAKQTKKVMLCSMYYAHSLVGNALGKEGSGVKTTSGMWCTMATCPLFGMPMVAGIVRVSCPKGSGFAVYYVYTWHPIALILGIRRRWCNTSPLCTSTLLATAWSSYCTLRLGIPTPNQVPDAILGGVRWSFGAKQCRHQYVSFHLLASPTYNFNNGP